MNRLSELALTVAETPGVLRLLPWVERLRQGGPRPALVELRQRARTCRRRGPAARRCLRRAIFWIDVCLPGGGNCYRRALLEMALDRGAATESFAMGLRFGDKGLSGHAWLDGPDRVGETYDLTVRL